MAHVVKFHPSLSLLEQYSEGTLTPEVALVVAAHLDFCPHCQSLHRDIEADLAWHSGTATCRGCTRPRLARNVRVHIGLACCQHRFANLLPAKCRCKSVNISSSCQEVCNELPKNVVNG